MISIVGNPARREVTVTSRGYPRQEVPNPVLAVRDRAKRCRNPDKREVVDIKQLQAQFTRYRARLHKRLSKKHRAPVRVSPERRDLDILCQAHVETLAGLTLREAQSLVRGWDRNWQPQFVFPDSPRPCRRCDPQGNWASLPKRTYRVRLIYPLAVDVVVTVAPYVVRHRVGSTGTQHECMDVAYLLWTLARVYKREIYRHAKKYGVWGHRLGDLYFDALEVRGNKIEVGMSS